MLVVNTCSAITTTEKKTRTAFKKNTKKKSKSLVITEQDLLNGFWWISYLLLFVSWNVECIHKTHTIYRVQCTYKNKCRKKNNFSAKVEWTTNRSAETNQYYTYSHCVCLFVEKTLLEIEIVAAFPHTLHTKIESNFKYFQWYRSTLN